MASPLSPFVPSAATVDGSDSVLGTFPESNQHALIGVDATVELAFVSSAGIEDVSSSPLFVWTTEDVLLWSAPLNLLLHQEILWEQVPGAAGGRAEPKNLAVAANTKG